MSQQRRSGLRRLLSEPEIFERNFLSKWRKAYHSFQLFHVRTSSCESAGWALGIFLLSWCPRTLKCFLRVHFVLSAQASHRENWMAAFCMKLWKRVHFPNLPKNVFRELIRASIIHLYMKYRGQYCKWSVRTFKNKHNYQNRNLLYKEANVNLYFI